MKKSMIFLFIAAIMAIVLAPATPHPSDIEEEHRLMDRVVMLSNEHTLCSGVQVKADSGKSYLLTAAHCSKIADEQGFMQVTTENGQIIKVKVIKEDENSDLLILERVPGLEGIPIAADTHKGEHVRTFTHGEGMPTYKTEGALLYTHKTNIPLFPIISEEDSKHCEMPKLKKDVMMSIFGEEAICVLSTEQMTTSARIVGGSSGGMVVNDKGELVGIVSASDNFGMFGFLVRIEDIRAFMWGL